MAEVARRGFKLTHAEFGDSGSLYPGQEVFAVGTPHGLTRTVTRGIVSNNNRYFEDTRGVGGYETGMFNTWLQTDAAINPGNSGGALVDINGNLLGINTAIYSRSGGSMGIGFAIPVTTAKQVLEGLVKDGQVTRGWIGVEPNDLSPELAETFDVKVKEGVIITGVLQNGPAAKAGIRPGDVIVAIADKPVRDVTQLLAVVSGLKPGVPVRFAVSRKNQTVDLEVSPGLRPKPRPGPQ
jgi:S1-C subfamily serine protease